MQESTEGHRMPILLLVLLIVLTVAAGWYLAWCTDYAPWGFSDSAAYFSAARNLAAGHSLSVSSVNGGTTPLNLHAPLYSLVLAVFVKLNVNLIHASKGMDIVFWTLFIFLCGWLFYRITGRQVAAICFALLCAFSTALVVSFSSLMSEPLALVLGIPGFLLLVLAVAGRSKKRMVLAAVMIGLSVLTRFAFAGVLAAGVLVVLIFSDLPWRKRWLPTLIFGGISAAPMAAWTVIQKLQQASTGGRSLVFTHIFSKLRNYGATVWGSLKYWLPYRSNMIPGVSAKYFAPLLAMVFMVIVVLGVLSAVRAKKSEVVKDRSFILAGASVFFILGYFAVLLAGFVFSSEPNDLNDRILSPLLPVFFTLLLSSVILLEPAVKRPVWTKVITIVLTLFFVVFNFDLLRTYGILASKYPNGYTSPYWNGSPIFEAISRLPTKTPLASNAPDIVLFYTNRVPFCLTENPTQRTDCLSATVRSQLQDVVERQCGVLILFPSSPTQNYENYADPISQSSMDGLNKLYTTLFTADHGQMLYWPECTDLKQAMAGQ